MFNNRNLMRQRLILILVPALAAAACVGAIVRWVQPGPTLPLREPGAEQGAAAQRLPDVFPGTLQAFSGKPSARPGAWPGFRGPRLDNIATEAVPLLHAFPAGGPRQLWTADLGEGYAGAAVADGRVYVLDYDMEKKGDALRCFSLDDGAEIWRRFYPVKVKRQHGMSRTIPTVAGDAVLTLGPKLHLMCTDARTGAFRWGKSLLGPELGIAKEPPWYAGQCPLVEGGRAILATGGKALLMALSMADGAILWQTPNPRRWEMTHSSILPVELGGRKMYVYCATGGVVGVDAADGRELWTLPDWKVGTANVPTPVAVGQDRLFFCGGYNAGSLMAKVVHDTGQFRAEVLFRLPVNVFGAEQQTPIFYQGFLYGVRSDGQLVCLDLAGKIRWSSGPATKFGLGPYLIADGMILAMNNDGLLTLAEASPEAYKPLAQAKVLTGHESWGPMALAGGRLIVRDLTRMVCLEMAAGQP